MDKVYFFRPNTQYGNSLEDKLKKLLRKFDMEHFVKADELVAIKVHVGERGNLGYINHNFARAIVEELQKRGAKPFLTDTNTLYSGGRHNAVDHYETATLHGFNYLNTKAPFIVADGLRGLDYIDIPFEGKHIKTAKLASGILKADKIVFLSHFKGHIEAGFGGTVKNLAMGCAAIPGKQIMHCSAKPEVNINKCTGCAQCESACPAKAITIRERKASINYDLCLGCGQCVAACNFKAMNAKWDETHDIFMEKLCEYAMASAIYFKKKAIYINFAMNITPDCDCWKNNDIPLVQDVGVFASKNPIALEFATLEAVNQSPKNNTSHFYQAMSQSDKTNIFDAIRPDINSEMIFDYWGQHGFTKEYELIEVK